MSAFNENNILMYLHCRSCMDQKPESESPQSWSRISVGYTKFGLQVWCHRCDKNMLHVDFEGHRHPADATASMSDD